MPTEAFYKLHPAKRDQLLKSAVHEFSEIPYEKVSVFKIAQNADVSRSGFYYYFKDKKDIHLYLINEIKEEFIKKYNVDELNVDLLVLGKDIFKFVTAIKGTGLENFFRRTVTDMKNSDVNDLFTFIDQQRPECGTRYSIDNIELTDQDQLRGIGMLMATSIIFALSGYFDNIDTLECAEEKLRQMFDIIRYGIGKEV